LKLIDIKLSLSGFQEILVMVIKLNLGVRD